MMSNPKITNPPGYRNSIKSIWFRNKDDGRRVSRYRNTNGDEFVLEWRTSEPGSPMWYWLICPNGHFEYIGIDIIRDVKVAARYYIENTYGNE